MQKIAINWENGNDKDEYDQKVNEKNYELKIISFERQQFVLKVDGVPMTNCQKKITFGLRRCVVKWWSPKSEKNTCLKKKEKEIILLLNRGKLF